jgi:hypothetical protein
MAGLPTYNKMITAAVWPIVARPDALMLPLHLQPHSAQFVPDLEAVLGTHTFTRFLPAPD